MIDDQRASGSARCRRSRASVVAALGHAQFGHALQRVCFAGRCADLAVQVDGFLQLVLRSGQIAGEQGCFARQRGRERDRPQGAGTCCGRAQRIGERQDLGIGNRAVEEVFGDAQMTVEHRVGEIGRVVRASELVAQLFEPLATVVGEQTLQRDEVEQLPVLAIELHAARVPARRARSRSRCRRSSRRSSLAPA